MGVRDDNNLQYINWCLPAKLNRLERETCNNDIVGSIPGMANLNY
jgi:hypothetical protein